MDLALLVLLYYGSALIALVYLLATRFRGHRRRALLCWLAIQFVTSLGVIALMDWSRRAGDREWYWLGASNIPVNVLFAIVYVAILLRREKPPLEEPAPSS